MAEPMALADLAPIRIGREPKVATMKRKVARRAVRAVSFLTVGLVISQMMVRTAYTGEPAAIVENVSVKIEGLRFMDYVRAGQTFELPPGATAILGYLQSCIRETIAGGTIKIGTRESTIVGGQVTREKVQCSGGAINLTPEEAAKSSVTVFRTPPLRRIDRPVPKPQFTIYGTRPVMTFTLGAGALRLERLDRAEEVKRFRVEGLQTLDLARTETSLKPGGIYRATTAGRSVVFKVDPRANDGAVPIVSRLIRF